MHRDVDYIKKYEPLWGGWYVEKLIGEGSFGKVYKIIKEEWGFRYESALKVICVPIEEQYREASSIMNASDITLMRYFEDSVINIVDEIRVMYALRGNSNIVGYEDHMVIKRDNPPGWDILIRMEYLKTLQNYIAERVFTRSDVIKLGIDICTAIETYSQRGIIHRDIKDENIFVSQFGDFKLGDFGISKVLSKGGRAASMKGTPLYMAPEVFRGDKYDLRVDIYSLGIVLYRLLNCGRIPLVPPYPQAIKYKDSEDALERRIAGEELNPPIEAGDMLADVVIKACKHDPAERYSTAMEMKEDLEAVLNSLSEEEKSEPLTLPGYKKIADISKENNGVDFIRATNKNNINDLELMDLDDIFFDDLIFENSTEQNRKENTFTFSQQNREFMSISKRGNTQGNILNGGIVSSQGLWDYYSINNKLCKVKMNDSLGIKLSDVSAWYINVLDEWIYFSNFEDDDSIYKIRIDGSGLEKLNNDKSWDITVQEDWIYYSNESEGYMIYKMKTDGSRRTRVCNDKSYCMNVTEDWIYYINKNDIGGHKCYED